MRRQSSTIIKEIFGRHFPRTGEFTTVLDLTYGDGGFWKWDYKSLNVHLTPAGRGQLLNFDFRAVTHPGGHFDVVTFDPPHTAAGCSTWADKYGICRKHGGPRNTGDTMAWLVAGANEAFRLARVGVVVKYKDCVEGGVQYHHWPLVDFLAEQHGWKCVEVIENNGARPQPEGRSYTTKVEPTLYKVYLKGKSRASNRRPA